MISGGGDSFLADYLIADFTLGLTAAFFYTGRFLCGNPFAFGVLVSNRNGGGLFLDTAGGTGFLLGAFLFAGRLLCGNPFAVGMGIHSLQFLFFFITALGAGSFFQTGLTGGLCHRYRLAHGVSAFLTGGVDIDGDCGLCGFITLVLGYGNGDLSCAHRLNGHNTGIADRRNLGVAGFVSHLGIGVLGLDIQLDGAYIIGNIIRGGTGETLLQGRNTADTAVKDDLSAHGRVVINRASGLQRQVYTSVRTVVQVDIAAEGTAPGGIVQAIAVMEGHPVIDKATVVFTNQISVGFLGIDAVNAGRSAVFGNHFTGDQGSGNQQFAVFVEPQMLGTEVDFNVGTAVGHRLAAAGNIRCFPGLGDTLFHAGDHVLLQGIHIHIIAAIGNGQTDSVTAGGAERTGGAFGAVGFAEGGHISIQGAVIDHRGQTVGSDGNKRENVRFRNFVGGIAEGVGEPGADHAVRQLQCFQYFRRICRVLGVKNFRYSGKSLGGSQSDDCVLYRRCKGLGVGFLPVSMGKHNVLAFGFLKADGCLGNILVEMLGHQRLEFLLVETDDLGQVRRLIPGKGIQTGQ